MKAIEVIKIVPMNGRFRIGIDDKWANQIDVICYNTNLRNPLLNYIVSGVNIIRDAVELTNVYLHGLINYRTLEDMYSLNTQDLIIYCCGEVYYILKDMDNTHETKYISRQLNYDQIQNIPVSIPAISLCEKDARKFISAYEKCNDKFFKFNKI